MPYDIIIGRDDTDKKKFGDRGLVKIGKGFVKMGQYTSLSNNIYMDVARSHVILVAGKRGSGKCLHEDTLISLENGSYIPIKDLELNKERVLSLNNSLKIESSEKTEFFSREVNKLLKIRLRSGKEIKLTPEHPLLTITGWRETQELKIGSRIATPRILSSFGNKEMPEHEVKLLAYLIAEGHTKEVVLFSNSDEKIVEEFRNSLNKFDSSLVVLKEKDNHYRISSPNWRNVVLNHNKERNEKGHFIKGNKNIYEKRSIRKLLEREELLGLLSTQKYLSRNIMKLKKENLSIFLNRLFSCDGSIYKSNGIWQISYSCSSEKMINQIQNLLLRFGIISKLRYKKMKYKEKYFDSYELVINSENSIKFINDIGFFGIKQKKQEIAMREISAKKFNPNVDTIPREVWDLYKPNNWAEVGRQLGYRHPKAMRERIFYAPSRQTLLQVANVDDNNSMRLLAESDIFWDEIIGIELLEGNFKVYDICVPKNHNFVANGIIVHNSYTLGTIAEELSQLPIEARKNIAPIIFDTMGIFWTMKYENEKEKNLLSEWDLKPKKLPVKVFVPHGYFNEFIDKGIPVDQPFALKISDLTAEDWVLIFDLNIINPVAVLIERVVYNLKDMGDYDISDIISRIRSDVNSLPNEKNAALGLFEAATTWGVFSKKGEKETSIKDLINSGTTTILDLSVYNSVGAFNVRALVIGLVCRKLFNERMYSRKREEIESVRHGADYLSYTQEREVPLVWVFIDEAHEFLPKEGKTSATDALIQILREGRQPGLSLVLATQQPGQIHKDVMTQSDIIISHRLTAQQDISALNEIMQTYLLENIRKYIDELPHLKGSAIILDDNSERIYPMRVRPRFTWHGGEAPTAVKVEKRF